ncbi:uncharacterized protein LOC109417411 [Aedes albopictus]|uniref:MD-2-related lipid-recognition domain-containing protein n=1 Tax=Aedes albopictus TaxID=7160 RepID=A0ABM1XK80_AEDAL
MMLAGIILSSLFMINGGRAKRIKEYVQEIAEICPNANSGNFTVQFPGPLNYSMSSNLIKLHGNFTITETIQEPLELIILIDRCALDMKTCEEHNKLTFTNLCRHVNDEKDVVAKFFKNVDPIVRCPIKPGIYKFKNAVFDLSFTLPLPMEGYRWQAKLKLYSRIRPKRELFCVSSLSSMHWVNKP